MSTGVSLQVKGVVEALATEHTQVTLDVGVTAEMSVEQALKGKCFTTNLAQKLLICDLNT